MTEEVAVMIHDRDAFNIQLDNDLTVIYIHPSCTENKYKLGDKLIQVDGARISSLQELPEHLICRAHFRTARLVFSRDPTLSPQPVRKVQVQEDVSKIVDVQEIPTLSCTVLNFDMHINRSDKLGLFLKEKGSHVYVYRTADCSLSPLYFHVGDKILEMDGHRISSVETAKKLFLKHFDHGKTLRISVERPEGLDQILANALAMNFGDSKTVAREG
ncbi:unnamed protein product [Bursaphelenchus xylophilus]|uniref:(pine wood nematode) hypothetical protein n=1 Tax=Bursaphelenchus xylophilus TaxID=6326 RepID=A0A1I7SB95_BURXY|nr:unnamed protein product [Bursaphelenchus xylophilus]CAG9131997.1 unnamed protein product [Bursaphelenchus xylophilus]